MLPLAWTCCRDCGETLRCLAQTCVYVAPKRNHEAGSCEVYDLMLEAEETGTKVEAVNILSPEEYADYSIMGYVRCLPAESFVFHIVAAQRYGRRLVAGPTNEIVAFSFDMS